jgi:lipopolysaccharide transport system ATP-binding protein
MPLRRRDRAARPTAARARPLSRPHLQNEIQVFRFDPGTSSFGSGAARITSAMLSDALGQSLQWIVGGELSRLVVTCKADVDLRSVIVGFFLKDRLGQHLFGDNTYLTYCSAPVELLAGQSIEAAFEFEMPILPVGQYSFDIAVADGTHLDHVQADWIHDAIVLESHSSSVSTGLVGIPMRSISLRVDAQA